MTAEIINLRQVRKRREREAKAAEAESNRARFGRTRAERERDEVDEAKARQHLDGHRLENGPDATPEEPLSNAAPETSAPKTP
jgi:hypothetical protein